MNSQKNTNQEFNISKPVPHDFTADIISVSISELKSNTKNARTHSKKQVAQISESIKQFGFVVPILVDAKNQIIAGHGRLEAAKLLGLEELPVIKADHLDDTQTRLLMLADNKIASNAGWDVEILTREFEELAVLLPELNLDLDLQITGFEAAEIDLIIADQSTSEDEIEDDVYLEDAICISKPGYLWQLGEHRLICGDARSTSITNALFDGKKARMVITDPPYNVKVDGHVGGRGKTKHKEFAFASGEMSTEEFKSFLSEFLKQTFAHLCDGGLSYVFMDWRHIEDLLAVGRELQFELKNICVWNKSAPGQGSFYRSAHELVAVFKKQGASSINNIELGRFGRSRTNIWSYPKVNTFKTGKDDDLAIHPTVKPVQMIVDAIKDASKRSEIIFDPLLGSGTALLAAERTGRRCYGGEYEPKYVDLAIRRWQNLTGKDAVFKGQIDHNSQTVTNNTGKYFDELQHEIVDGVQS